MRERAPAGEFADTCIEFEPGWDATWDCRDAVLVGDLLISTVGNGDTGTLTWADEDVVRFSFTGGPGDPTAGVWSAFFDGSASDGANGSGLNVNGEDIDGFGLDTGGPDLHLSTVGNIRTFETPAGPPYRAQDDDVTTCVVEPGATITCDEWETLLEYEVESGETTTISADF